MDASEYSGSAESMVEFVESNTKFTVTPIRQPPVISKVQMMFAIAILAIWTPHIIKRIVTGKMPFHNKNLWMTVSILVYFFSVSGVLYNVIRKMPMFLADRDNSGRLIFFHQGSELKLGDEGFAVGFLYIVAGLLLAFVTHALVYTENKILQRLVIVFVLFVSLWAVGIVVFVANIV